MEGPKRDFSEALERLRDDLDRLREKAEFSRKLMETPEWQARRAGLQDRLLLNIDLFSGKDGNEALFVIGKCHEIVQQIIEPERMIEMYEQKKKALSDAEGRLKQKS